MLHPRSRGFAQSQQRQHQLHPNLLAPVGFNAIALIERSSLRELPQKVKARAKRQLKSVGFLQILEQMVPRSLQFYRSVWGDPSLPTLRRKLHFIAAIHWLKWVVVWEVGREFWQLKLGLIL